MNPRVLPQQLELYNRSFSNMTIIIILFMYMLSYNMTFKLLSIKKWSVFLCLLNLAYTCDLFCGRYNLADVMHPNSKSKPPKYSFTFANSVRTLFNWNMNEPRLVYWMKRDIWANCLHCQTDSHSSRASKLTRKWSQKQE